MGVDMSKFDAAVQRFTTREIPEKVRQKTQEIALEALSGVVFLTPVNSGRARGNWQVSTNQPITVAVEREDKDGAATIGAGATVIAGSKPYEVIHIVNNLAYIRALEDGSSTQAPNGMVAVTVNRIMSARP